MLAQDQRDTPQYHSVSVLFFNVHFFVGTMHCLGSCKWHDELLHAMQKVTYFNDVLCLKHKELEDLGLQKRWLRWAVYTIQASTIPPLSFAQSYLLKLLFACSWIHHL